MPLFVRSFQTYTLDLSQQKTVGDGKALVPDNEFLPKEQMTVVFEGQLLEDEWQLAALRDKSTLSIELRLLGGNVHGTLASAGKVRGQTPEAEKQEKNWPCQARMQYKRGFVKVVAGFGRRKRPNVRS
ncbi:unnamed protein product [Candidula unifasciata]|uniref:Ubiquitin-like domain-containing protein n=1 Tax=Candidula unifasciata TaxID=100452 RepID=A0A8S3YMU7_9EUPU|nr:unnamed protein product [Candidula unifasciata]